MNDAMILLQRKQEQVELKADRISHELDAFKENVTDKTTHEVQITMEANIKAEVKSAMKIL